MAVHEFKPSLRRATVLQIVALTIFTSMLLFVGAEFQRTTLQSVDHANQVINVARELFKLTIDMETGLRGFRLTGNKVFLQPYDQASQVIDARFIALDKLLSGSPSERAQLASIRDTFDRWRPRTVEVIRKQEAGEPESIEGRERDMLVNKVLMYTLR